MVRPRPDRVREGTWVTRAGDSVRLVAGLAFVAGVSAAASAAGSLIAGLSLVTGRSVAGDGRADGGEGEKYGCC